MRFLVSNDDGVNAPGLAMLAAQMSTLGEVVVVAPDRDRSAASNSLTLDRPLRLHEQPNGFFALNGTPTDCVHLAMTGLFEQQPDMIIAGINSGANLGDDVLYSGTVACAMEGRFLGLPAIAFSLVSNNREFRYYDTAGFIARNIVEQLLKAKMPPKLLLNVNIPDIPLSDIQGYKVTRKGQRHIAEPIIKTLDPAGKTIYWIGPAGKEQDAGEGTDFSAVNQGYVSITPIKVDLTDFGLFEEIRPFVEGLS